jgi:hypothetical protein
MHIYTVAFQGTSCRWQPFRDARIVCWPLLLYQQQTVVSFIYRSTVLYLGRGAFEQLPRLCGGRF